MCFRVVVGAPEADTNQPGVKRGGAVYMCSITRDDCRQVPFDRTGECSSSYHVLILVSVKPTNTQRFYPTVELPIPSLEPSHPSDL